MERKNRALSHCLSKRERRKEKKQEKEWNRPGTHARGGACAGQCWEDPRPPGEFDVCALLINWPCDQDQVI